MRRVHQALVAAGLALAGVAAVQIASDIRFDAPAPTAWVTDAAGSFITQSGHQSVRPGGGRQIDYGYWPVIPPSRVVAATLALEDRRFWRHPGVDPIAVVRAVWQHLSGGRGSGASTIAMQVVRMQHPRPRTLWSKAIEAGAAVGLTLRYGRAAVLAQYLRLAPYGESSHGIAHAARWYFNRPADDLSVAQAALLCAIPQSPGHLSLRRPGRIQARARRAILAMDLDDAARSDALAALPTIAPRPAPRRPPDLLLVERLQRDLPAGEGPILRATIELGTQDWVRGRADAHLTRWRLDGAQQAAVMVLRRRDRAVVADVGGQSGIDFTREFRSPGSTLKPFLYAIGLDRGLITPQQIAADAPERASGISNADHDFLGNLLPRQALANSRNVPAAALLRQIGLQPAFDALRRLGLHDRSGSPERFGLAMAIGALPTTLERLMRAYATLADDGRDRPLAWFAGAPAPATQLIGLDAARLVGRFLSDPIARLPSFPRYGSSEYPFAVALKTGTSQGYRDAWTLAWSRDYVVGVWVGRGDAGPMTRLSGARAAAGLAQEVMLHLHGSLRTDLVAGEFAPPPGRVPTELCARTGRPAGPDCAEQLTEWVHPGAASASAPETQLAITRPGNNLHVWRNPNLPAALNRLVLHASVEPKAAQIVWLLNGEPISTAESDAPLVWTMIPGRYRFQIRLAAQNAVSLPVHVVVE